ncbi:ABC transporter substrate-binding protein [Paraburkholderia sp. SIMBA_055]|jgi:putative spermidine/putrescine transport system substrate-binding protein|uniref:Extracellular solute-binding protein family 1 n=2 Tax=Paraburkholderia graminis TaxID=60548 RepID=B1GB41_PARG4|nr:ABC transporter substrate-binding protein [Paraburkholderia graminis]AXF07714.1 ABC transporter substrate-binding protein [Paraburkholderia graminis]EDT06642.1 extracellular solute-binding protein family 1 [Paraburkholderia graminis C4D1M]MDQ0622694.1 putative spermidine/putrescine transport system substrate-binding protein [Paraburkholderia graminis]MDR6207129.1 putative spermidine/putrescine transport system substrate-binding protein [Paraburkholderia graminis]MDR6466451.1 putative spermi
MTQDFNAARRRILHGAGALAVASALPLAARAQAKQIVVSDPGGPYTTAYREAFYDPFEKATGIKVVSVARESQPVAQFAAMVQTKNYVWDVTTLTLSADIPYLEAKGLLEPIGLKASDYPELMPEAITPNWLGVDVYSTVLAYRADKFKDGGPKSWADFWDVKKFPGRRCLRRSPLDTLEQALLADGVPLDKLYPLDVDRAFKSLDRIKPHVNIWWTSGAQAMQAIQSGDVDMISTWNGRAQAAKDAGAPVTIVWNQGLYSIEGWGIPKGTPRADAAKQFVRFCADAKRQALLTRTLAYGPTNKKAFETISKERATLLPTAPDNLRDMRLPSPQWWEANRQKVTERFNSWIIS